MTLFDGKTLDGLNKAGDANWRVEDGLAVADKGRGFLVTKEQYGDFEIRVEFWADVETNSGIYFRCTSAQPANEACYEANIYDKRPTPFGTGAIVGVAETVPRPLAAGRWNTYDLTVKGDHFMLVMNGVKTADGHDAKRPAPGYVGLQLDAVGKQNAAIKFRKVEIRRL
jgi:hypothetical protein